MTEDLTLKRFALKFLIFGWLVDFLRGFDPTFAVSIYRLRGLETSLDLTSSFVGLFDTLLDLLRTAFLPTTGILLTKGCFNSLPTTRDAGRS